MPLWSPWRAWMPMRFFWQSKKPNATTPGLSSLTPTVEQILDAIQSGNFRTGYHGDDHHAIRDALDVLNEATHKLAENMMNTAVSGALKGTKI